MKKEVNCWALCNFCRQCNGVGQCVYEFLDALYN